jgi:cytochrome c556
MGSSMIRTVLGFAAALALILPAGAADTPASVKYRQAVMTAQGGHMSALNALLRGEVDHKDHVRGHVEGIGATAEMVRDLFPAGSDKGETEALPAIWEKPAEFSKAVDALQAAAANLASAGRSGDMDAVRAAFGETGKACKGCHDNFRKKK